jgi:YVTN family beta-propeller protein
MSYPLAVRLRRPVVLALSLFLVVGPATPAFAQGNCSGGVSASPPVDNRDGYLVNLEEAPIHPLEFGSTGDLWQANLPDGRIVVWKLTTPLAPARLDEVAVGLGPVSIRLRPAAGPAPREIWVACQSSNAVFVIDEATRKVTKSVRLIGEPTDIAFDAANQFAYVSLAATNRIAKVNANTLAVQPPLTFDSDYPPGGAARAEVEEPRALMRDGNSLFVLSHMSGNGTFPLDGSLFDPAIVNGWQFGFTPPDRDVLAFDLTAGAPTGLAALWRMGTLNFDFVKATDGRTYVSTVDFGNQTLAPTGLPTIEGEFDYKAKGFGRHLITHAVAGTGFPQTGTLAIDLNVDVDPFLPSTFRCAVPTDIAYDAANQRLFVACYETRNVAVVQLNSTPAGGTVIAELLAAPLTAPRAAAFGPRGVALSANGQTAYVLYRGDHKLQAFDLTTLAAGSQIPPSAAGALAAGFDITPLRILNGRRHFLNAANSGTGTSTCNTCHMDGHLDGIGWDLSDFTGKLDSTPAPEKIGREPKGTKVTMSLRGIEETPPFHWRGDRADLDAFNPAFFGLLGGAVLTLAQLREFEDFVFSLSYPANPNLADNRAYTSFAKDGFDCFVNHTTMHTVLHDATGGLGSPTGNLDVSCAGCHAMDGASGTLNQVNNPFPVTAAAVGDDATQLRGLWDKESQTVSTGLPVPLDQMPATGWGFANTGVVDSVINFINIGVFNHLGHDVQIERFLKEFDTGIAPTAAFAVMLTGGATTPDETLLTSALAAAQPLAAIPNGAANFPAHDLIARGWVRLVAGGPQIPMGMLWNGTQFQTDRTVTTFTLAALKAKVAAGDAAVALVGVPVGSGYRLGIDRDLDFRLDGDEVSIVPTTATDNPDSDNDTFPDGYEIRLGSNPALFSSVPPVELIPPKVITGRIAWINSDVVKARWSTDEESTTRLRVWKIGPGGVSAIVYDREDSQFKKYHSAVGRKLEPGDTYRVEAITKDPRGNTRTFVLNSGVPSQPFLFLSTHVANTVLTRTGPGTVSGTQAYTASTQVFDETGTAIADGAMVAGTLVEWDSAACTFTPGVTPPGTCSTVTTIPAAPTVSGTATFNIQGTRVFSNGTAEFFVNGVVDNTPSSPNPGLARLYFKPLAGQLGFWAQASVP